MKSKFLLIVSAIIAIPVLGLVWLAARPGYVHPYYDHMPVGTPVELVEQYADQFQAFVKLSDEFKKSASDFDEKKQAATKAFEEFSAAREEERAALTKAASSTDADSASAFAAARAAKRHAEQVYKQVDVTQEAARAAFNRARKHQEQLERAKIELDRAKDDYKAIACGGTRRFVQLDVGKVNRAEQDYVNRVRASAAGDQRLQTALTVYDAAFERMDKVLQRSKKEQAISDAASREYYESRQLYDDLAQKAVDEGGTENETAARAAFLRWSRASLAEKECRQMNSERQKEYNAASDEYRRAFDDVVLAAR